MPATWWVYVPAGALIALDVIEARWLVRLDRRLQEQGERLAYLEGQHAERPRSDE